ncbi:HhH-GPD-type base excision DNA repair protein [Candidatus Mycolicibacterium alkanivorans]|uniref:Fe-S cluster assembly protein HesB n=1 Tax=Candidatus Mycolicibacterium alkanivorans TaxID=2954114 RepID=A0ABS9YUJ2_9MYCO|nr:HhH-GPD-type base excision DNA repair protein [Candidatus Mycolicibacterium alkanivorans]MCI4674879.1 Fe-S cluster assembly protein HesB [Candidatus Mycolicibacterium alkanivorans]
MARLQLTQDPASDDLLSEDPFALLTGMLLDQQVPMETAFTGPRKIVERIGGIDPRLIADYDPAEFAEAFAKTPAVHRFPSSMAKRVQDLAREIVDRYDGEAARLWLDGNPDGAEVLRRLKALPGFGEQKAKIFLALLGKQYGVTPSGWRSAAGDYGRAGTHMSIADVVDKGSLDRGEREKKTKAKAKAEEILNDVAKPPRL